MVKISLRTTLQSRDGTSRIQERSPFPSGTNERNDSSQSSFSSRIVPKHLRFTVAFGILLTSCWSKDRRCLFVGAIRHRPEEPSRRLVLRASSSRSHGRRDSLPSHRFSGACLAEDLAGLRMEEGRVFPAFLTKICF